MKYLFYSGFYCCIAVMMLCSCNGRNKGSDNSTESTDSAYDVSAEIQGNSHNSAENMEASSSCRMNTENGGDSAGVVQDILSPEDEAYEAGHSQGYDDGSADAATRSEHGTSFDEDNKYTGKVAEQYEEGYSAGYNEGYNALTR